VNRIYYRVAPFDRVVTGGIVRKFELGRRHDGLVTSAVTSPKIAVSNHKPPMLKERPRQSVT
jgi:hypothetical protein